MTKKKAKTKTTTTTTTWTRFKPTVWCRSTDGKFIVWCLQDSHLDKSVMDNCGNVEELIALLNIFAAHTQHLRQRLGLKTPFDPEKAVYDHLVCGNIDYSPFKQYTAMMDEDFKNRGKVVQLKKIKKP